VPSNREHSYSVFGKSLCKFATHIASSASTRSNIRSFLIGLCRVVESTKQRSSVLFCLFSQAVSFSFKLSFFVSSCLLFSHIYINSNDFRSRVTELVMRRATLLDLLFIATMDCIKDFYLVFTKLQIVRDKRG